MAAPAAVTTFTVACDAFIAAAVANNGDPSLNGRLAALPDLCASAIAALRSAGDPEVGSAVSACEVLLAQCSTVADQIAAQAPPIIDWKVPAPMPLAVVAERFYGAEASQHFTEILTNNPDILGEILIPAGTDLRLAKSQ